MTLILDQIRKSKKQGQLISICINSVNWAKRIIGYVKTIYSSDKFDFQIIDEKGQRKERRLIYVKTIKSLEIGGVYNDSLDLLVKKGFPKKKSQLKYYIVGRQNIHQKLIDLLASGTLCTFFFKNGFSIGVVKMVSPDAFSIKNISFEGADDGASFFELSALVKIRIGSNLENRIATFFATKNI